MPGNAPLRGLPHPYACGPERLCKPEVTGSIPVRSTRNRLLIGRFGRRVGKRIGAWTPSRLRDRRERLEAWLVSAIYCWREA
jgi:hypothetical protein